MGMPSSFKVHLLSWLTLVGIILLQSISNTNSNFSIYSSQLKQLLSISNLQVHNLFIASEVGKLFGCIPTAVSNHLPIWTLLIIGVGMGLVSYGVQFLYMVNQISSLSYWHLLSLQFLAGNSMSWINTACNVAAMRSFPAESRMIITLTSAYSGFSAKIYTSMVEGVHGKGARNASTYLLLSSLVPIAFGLAFLILVRDFSSKQLLIPLFHDTKRAARTSFLIVVFLVVSATEGYSLVDSVVPAFRVVPPLQQLAILLVLMITLPLGVPLVMVLRQAILLKPKELPPSSTPHDMLPNNIDHAQESSIECDQDQNHTNPDGGVKEQSVISVEPLKTRDDVNTIVNEGDHEHHDEHRVVDLLLNVDFWLLFWGCACGATLSNVYFSNLECISKYSHSYGNSETRFLLAISSAYGFYGRLFTVMLDWFTRGKYISRPLTMVILMIPMTMSFFLILNSSLSCFYLSTAILGFCSGIISAISGPITTQLFGSQNSTKNNQIILANVPVACLIFGYITSLLAHSYKEESLGTDNFDSCIIGVDFYFKMFIIWGSVCFLGTILCFALYLRTRKFYK